MKMGALVIAAGYGSFRKEGGIPYPKILEDLHGKPLIAQVLETLRSIELDPVVIINPLFGNQIRNALSAVGFGNVRYIIQPDRFGTAEAVERALPIFKEEGITDFLAMYGDMPLWREKTLRALIECHLRNRAILSMVSVTLREASFKDAERYGRIIRDEVGSIIGIFEAGDAYPEGPISGRVNPSLWVWNTDWVSRHISRVPPRERPDGRQAERQLPLLVGIASQEDARITELPLDDATEALGINNMNELALVRNLFGRT